MSGAAHTPGPWEWTQDEAGQWFLSPGILISDASDGTPGGDEHDQANARLIAAAPDLLEALIALKAGAVLPGGVNLGQLAQAEAAIAKATGADS